MKRDHGGLRKGSERIVLKVYSVEFCSTAMTSISEVLTFVHACLISHDSKKIRKYMNTLWIFRTRTLVYFLFEPYLEIDRISFFFAKR